MTWWISPPLAAKLPLKSTFLWPSIRKHSQSILLISLFVYPPSPFTLKSDCMSRRRSRLALLESSSPVPTVSMCTKVFVWMENFKLYCIPALPVYMLCIIAMSHIHPLFRPRVSAKLSANSANKWQITDKLNFSPKIRFLQWSEHHSRTNYFPDNSSC